MQHIPKYYKISHEIISTIQNGELQPGMKVPSENEIISEYDDAKTYLTRDYRYPYVLSELV